MILVDALTLWVVGRYSSSASSASESALSFFLAAVAAALRLVLRPSVFVSGICCSPVSSWGDIMDVVPLCCSVSLLLSAFCPSAVVKSTASEVMDCAAGVTAICCPAVAGTFLWLTFNLIDNGRLAIGEAEPSFSFGFGTSTGLVPSSSSISLSFSLIFEVAGVSLPVSALMPIRGTWPSRPY